MDVNVATAMVYAVTRIVGGVHPLKVPLSIQRGRRGRGARTMDERGKSARMKTPGQEEVRKEEREEAEAEEDQQNRAKGNWYELV